MENRQGMANQSYYRLTYPEYSPTENDMRVESEPLVVNCCGETVVRQAWSHAAKRRRQDFYLILSLGGEIRGCLGDERISLGSGNMICIAPGTDFMLESRDPQEEWTHYFWIHFTGSEARQTLERSGIDTNRVYSIDVDGSVYSHYERLFEEFRLRDESFDYAAELLLRNILLHLGRACAGERRARLDRSIRYIHTHIRYDLTVEQLAAMEYLGVSRYRELFRECTGVSPIDYVIRLRIARACDLLSRTDTSIAEVAESVGYENRHHFHNTFKRFMGMTPGEYRRQKAGQYK